MYSHRTLEAWKEARAITLLVVDASRKHWKPWASALFAQIQRAAASVELNIAEGYTFGKRPTYARHLGIAYGSAVETGELIDLLIAADVLPHDRGQELITKSSRCQKLLVGLLKRYRPL